MQLMQSCWKPKGELRKERALAPGKGPRDARGALAQAEATRRMARKIAISLRMAEGLEDEADEMYLRNPLSPNSGNDLEGLATTGAPAQG